MARYRIRPTIPVVLLGTWEGYTIIIIHQTTNIFNCPGNQLLPQTPSGSSWDQGGKRMVVHLSSQRRRKREHVCSSLRYLQSPDSKARLMYELAVGGLWTVFIIGNICSSLWGDKAPCSPPFASPLSGLLCRITKLLLDHIWGWEGSFCRGFTFCIPVSQFPSRWKPVSSVWRDQTDTFLNLFLHFPLYILPLYISMNLLAAHDWWAEHIFLFLPTKCLLSVQNRAERYKITRLEIL